MPLPPHDIMRYVMTNKTQRIFGDESIWLCLTCETCSARCPNGVDPARIIDGLRELSVADGFEATPRSIRAFHQAFLDQVRLSGRLYEVGFVMEYKMRSGNLFSDITNAPSMLKRGKLPIMPSRIDGQKDVARIMDRCAKDRGTTEGGQS